MTKDIDKNYKLIPMSDITPEAREIAKRWYDGVSEMNDIREKHKLASDIMNYAQQEAIAFGEWILENGLFVDIVSQEKRWMSSVTTEQLYLIFKHKYLKQKK